MRKAFIIALASTAALSIALLAFPHAHASVETDQQNFARIERGRYLTDVADCAACHTGPTPSKPFAGGRRIETPFGILVSTNLTPDRDTGIGAWSDDEFDAAVRHGRGRGGVLLYPAMPFPAYTKMSREDTLAIRAYLSTLAPVHNDVVANQLPFPLNVRTSMRVWDALYFSDREFSPDPSRPAEWNRGAYLVEGPGHCGTCHTPKTMLGGDKATEALQGYAVQGWFAPEITSDETRGLGRWSIDDIVAYLRTGHNAFTAATGPMADEIAHSSSRMHDDDLRAIATYLKSVPGSSKPSPSPADERVMAAGGAIYRDVCSACHGINGEGVPNLFPALAKSPSVRSTDATSLVRVVLQGARSVATPREPTAPAMPAFGWQLDDAQLAAVVTYVRNSWGSAASAISADDVRKQRAALTLRTD
jgi:mono/diheme cytochrome c family protein